MKKASAWFDEILESLIAQRITKVDQPEGEGKKTEESKDFLQLLLELNQQGDDKTSISMDEVEALLMDMVVAGRHTTSTVVEWTMTELLRHPESMGRVIEELDRVVGAQNVELSHVPQLLYLDVVIK
ncbi:hypothetical protein REPUB_Repub07fG0116800 [Reevesia pubescens]